MIQENEGQYRVDYVIDTLEAITVLMLSESLGGS